MNTDLKELFNERNQSLFFNKLIMDLENNTDTFQLATKNIIKMEIAKLLSSLRKIYNDYSVKIDEDKIKALLSNSKNSILADINILIDNKSKNNKKYINNSDKSSVSTKKYIKTYHKFIDENEDEFKETLKLAVREEAELGIYTSLINLYPCVNEEMQQAILEKINLDFSNSLINRISSESFHRNMTLKNMSEETYKSYLNLNKQSSKIEKNSKVKVIKNN